MPSASEAPSALLTRCFCGRDRLEAKPSQRTALQLGALVKTIQSENTNEPDNQIIHDHGMRRACSNQQGCFSGWIGGGEHQPESQRCKSGFDEFLTLRENSASANRLQHWTYSVPGMQTANHCDSARPET